MWPFSKTKFCHTFLLPIYKEHGHPPILQICQMSFAFQGENILKKELQMYLQQRYIQTEYHFQVTPLQSVFLLFKNSASMIFILNM